MRLTALRLQRYGPFTDTEVSLDPAPGRVNLLLAPNGAGKSVLRGAFGDLLFGIGGQTHMGFRYGYTGMQVSARGVGPDGASFAFGRRKGQGNTLLDGDGNPGDHGALRRLVGTADRTLLERLFALDTELLRGGGRALLESGGVLSEALLAAAGGVREAQRVRQRLEDGRDSLAPLRRVAQRPFYVALDRWTTSRKASKAELLHPDRWAREEAARDAARQRHTDALASVSAANTKLRKLERVRRVRPLLARLDDAEAWLRSHPDAPMLPGSLAERFPLSRAALARADEECARAEKQRGELRTQAADIVLDDTLLGREEDVETLAEAAGAAERARSALPGARAEAAAKQGAVAERARQLGTETLTAPPRAALNRVRRLLDQRNRRADALRDLPLRADEAQRRLETAEADLSALTPAHDVGDLAELVAAATRDGDPAGRLAAALRARAEAEEALRAVLARLPAELRGAGAVERASLPEPEAVERLHAACQAAAAAHEAASGNVARLEAELETIEARRAQVTEHGPLPDEDAVAVARAHRDRGWHLVFRRAFGDGADPVGEASYAGGEPLALAYARALAAADAMADRRTSDASRVAEAAHLAGSARAVSDRLDTARAAMDEARRHLCARHAEWDALSASVHLPPGVSLAELRRVLDARTAALDASRAVRTADAVVGEVRAFQEGAACRLARHLGTAPGAALPDALHAANARLRQAREADGKRGALGAMRDEARAALGKAEAEHRALLQQQDAWQAEWQDAIRALGRLAGEHPDDTEAVLELLDGAGALLNEARDAQGRVAASEDELRAFAERWAAVNAAVAPGLAGLDPFEGARLLGRQLRDETLGRERRAVLDRQAEAAEAALVEARLAQDAAAVAWQAMLAECGAATAEEAEVRIALGAERAARADAATRARGELAEAGDGLALDTLRDEVAALPPEQVEAALAGARMDVERHAQEAGDAAGEAARLGGELARLADENAALRHRADEEAAGAQLGATLDDALLMHTAATLLEAALAELEAEGDDAMLRRIGAAFAALTDGAYVSACSEPGDRGARLFLRAAGGEEMGVEQLSEGTRDQLFLALRLVAIQDHVAGGSALPLLGDDILQTFDDTRAAAAFRVLREFSETVQVVLLSHHPHLVDVARNALPPGALHVQDLAAVA